ncbi:MAG: DUF2914 domain-containing protein [Deltaproteobacteria bacterium]|nr:DUF2914 domain-containing protein [Deltaproteobacteria bacterium]
MRMALVFGVTLALLGSALHTSPAQACEEGAAVATSVELKLAKEIQARQPVAPGDTFTPGKIYAWTRVTGGEDDFTVYHVWIKDGKRLWKQPVSVKGKRWTTWSYFNARPGAWRVEVQDEGGKVLAAAAFTVK